MMKFSIVVGCLHLILANAVVAVREIGISGKARPLGWIAVILGGLAMYLGAGFVRGDPPGGGAWCRWSADRAPVQQ